MHKVALAALAVVCLAQSGSAANCNAQKKGQKQTLSQADIDTILERHNYERDLVTGMGYADVHYLHWSMELQQLAETLAGSCVFAHSSSECRSHSTLASYCGENLAATSIGSGTLNQEIYKMCNMWNAEKADYTFSNGKCRGGKACGHYTQVIWADTKFVGCAVTKCQSGILSMPSYDLRCVYAKGGNWGGELATHPASGACLTKDKCGPPTAGACIISASGYSCECHDGYANQASKATGKCIKGGSPPTCSNGNDCNNHGACVSGKCNCNNAWKGIKCADPNPTCKAATTCNGHGTCDTATNKCKCSAGWEGNSCALKHDVCAGFCKHGTCTKPSNVPQCKCDGGWEGKTCDSPSGGAWQATGIWVKVMEEVTARRRNYGRNAIPYRSLDRTWAVRDAAKCDRSYHSESEVDSHGLHTWTMMLCMNKDEAGFAPYAQWLGRDVIAKMAKFATSKWTTGFGCAISSGPCTGVANSCGGQTYRMLLCHYELKPGHAIPQNSDETLDTEATPPRLAAAGSSIMVPVLAAAVVALAAVIVVLAIKLRRAQQSTEEVYTEMTA